MRLFCLPVFLFLFFGCNENSRINSINRDKVIVCYNDAIRAREEANHMYEYLQAYKELIASKSGGWTNSTKSALNDNQNLSVTTEFMITRNHAHYLRDSLDKFRNTMQALLHDDNKTEDIIRIYTDDPPKGKDGISMTWEEYYWKDVPPVGAVAELTKYQNDVRNAEADVMSFNWDKAMELTKLAK